MSSAILTEHAQAGAIVASQATGQWHLLYVKSRQEKILADELRAMDIAHYVPLVRDVRYYGKRKAVVETPLFSGYVFLWGSLDEAYTADRTKRVSRIIRVADQRQLDWELQNLRKALSSDARLTPYPCLPKGTRVEVKSGPFRGLQGVVEDRKADRLILQVDVLSKAVSLEIDGALLEAV